MFFFQTLLLCLIAAATILAHPGHDIAEEIVARAKYLERNPGSLSKCSSNLQARGLSSEYITRRHNLANELRAARGLAVVPSLDARDFAAYNFSHLYSESSIGVDSHVDTDLGENSSCVLQPEVTAGPYLVTAEAERSNVTNGERGVPLTLLVQIIDTATCKPATALYVDMWQANSTGVYSGVMVDGNGNSKDATNLKNTALRGFQQKDSIGVVRFDTLFPGHYTGNYPCYIFTYYSTANLEHRPCKPHPHFNTQPKLHLPARRRSLWSRQLRLPRITRWPTLL